MSLPWPDPVPGPDDTGPLYGRVRVYLAIPTPADVWDTARWDTARWDAGGADVVDVTCDCDGVDITYGRDSATSHQAPMTAKFSLNNRTGDYTPWANTPHRRRRWFIGSPVHIASEDGPLFTGYIADMSELDATLVDEDRETTFTASGPAGFLARANGIEQAAQGANELAGARLDRICDQAAVPAWVPRAFDTGVVPMQATTLAKGALEEAWLTADSDGGAFLELPDGTLQFLDAGTLDGQPRYTEPQYTFTDTTPTDAPVVQCVTSFTASLSTDNVVTIVSIAAAGGTAYVAENPADEWAGTHTFERHDLIYADEAHAGYLAEMILLRLSSAELSLDPIEFDPLLSDVNWQCAHQIRPYDRIRLVRTRGDQYLDVTASVDNVHHTITNLAWSTSITSSPGLQKFDFTRWDVAHWDTDKWS